MTYTPSMNPGWQRARSSAGALARATLLTLLLLSGLGGLAAASASPAHAGYEWCDMC